MKNEQILGNVAALSRQQNLQSLRRMARPKPQPTKITSTKPIIYAIAAAAVVALCTASSGWATGPSPAAASSTHHETTAQTDNRQVQQTNSYVRDVEKNVSSYKRNEEKLSPGELKEVTDKEWNKIHTYTDGDQLKRMKLYPSDGSQRTEEFYYKDGNLVFVFLEENGLGKENHDANAKGDTYYFQDRKLIAAIGADGQPMNVNGSEAKRMEEKILKESRAFRAAAKDKTLALERY
jgi:hypothetical protein